MIIENMTPEVIQDFIAIQAERPALRRDADNPYFESKYMNLEGITAKIFPLLKKHNFGWIVTVDVIDGNNVAIGHLVHTTGHVITTRIRMGGAKMQDIGSGITYARRYMLLAVLGYVADMDDDQYDGTANRLADQPAPMPPDGGSAEDWINAAREQATTGGKQAVKDFYRKAVRERAPEAAIMEIIQIGNETPSTQVAEVPAQEPTYA